MKFRIGDTVIVVAGSDKGKTGVVAKISLNPNKVQMEGVNKCVRHIKGRNGEPGQKVEIYKPIDASNLALIDPTTGKATKVGYKMEAGTKVRFARATGKVLPKVVKAKAKAKTAAPKKTNAQK